MFAEGWSFLKAASSQSEKMDKTKCQAYNDGFAEYTCLPFTSSIEIRKVSIKNQLDAPVRDTEYGLLEDGKVICYGKMGEDGNLSFRTKLGSNYELDLLDSDDDFELENG